MQSNPENMKSYNKAPIIEAIIDIAVVYEKKDITSALDSFKNTIKTDYPESQPLNIATTEIRFQPNNASFHNFQENIGLKFISRDKKYILQIRNQGFTLSMLGNYSNWQEFSSKARSLWDLFCKEFNPVKVNRVAVRYINRIDLPSTKVKLEDYFLTYPMILKSEEVSLNGFFLQAQLPQPQGGMAIINQTTTEAPKPDVTSILLDIDVFDFKEFTPEEGRLWERLNQLREQKNNLFEKSITENTRRLFL